MIDKNAITDFDKGMKISERFELKCNDINPNCAPEDVYQHLQKEALK